MYQDVFRNYFGADVVDTHQNFKHLNTVEAANLYRRFLYFINRTRSKFCKPEGELEISRINLAKSNYSVLPTLGDVRSEQFEFQFNDDCVCIEPDAGELQFFRHTLPTDNYQYSHSLPTEKYQLLSSMAINSGFYATAHLTKSGDVRILFWIKDQIRSEETCSVG